MARCVSLHQKPRLSAAVALAFHDEAMLEILRDNSRELFPPDVHGISAGSWEGRRRVQVVLAGPGSCRMRQVRISNGGDRDGVYFLGAVLVPPIDSQVLRAELVDDFGICSARAAPEGASAEPLVRASAPAAGSTVCQIPRGSEYFVTLRFTLPHRPANPTTRSHILALAFHDEAAAAQGRMPGDSPLRDPCCFHLFVSVQIGVVAGLHEAPALNELRATARPFFPECLHRLFDNMPSFFLVSQVPSPDASFAAFQQRQHAPACVWVAPPAQAWDLPVWEQPASDETHADGHPPMLVASHISAMLKALTTEEEAMRIGIAHFDMFHATMKSVSTLPGAERRRLGIAQWQSAGDISRLLYRLEVPGLHEGKPSVFRGDPVHIRPDGQGYETTVEMCCCAVVVLHSQLVVQVPGEALQILRDMQRVHVRFSIDHAKLEAMRGAGSCLLKQAIEATEDYPSVDQLTANGVQIPPQAELMMRLADSEREAAREQTKAQEAMDDQANAALCGWQTGQWFGELNDEQRQVVEKLQTMPRYSPPLLLLGPPGTGKSWAVAEAVCQWLHRHVRLLVEAWQSNLQGEGADTPEQAPEPRPAARILLCAPTDIACDLLVETVHERLQPRGSTTVMPAGLLLRFNEPRRPSQQLFSRSAVFGYSVLDEQTGCFQYPEDDALCRAVVVVCTLRAAWALRQRLDRNKLAFDYILIDEAGQALELESYAALTLGKPGARVLLAGDTKQLGPVCRAAQHGRAGDGGAAAVLRCSLLERLSEHHPRWNCPETPHAIHLRRNYRSHPAILELLSATRYDGSLIAAAAPELVCKFEQVPFLPKRGFPIVFVGVRGQQRMDLRNENQHCLSRPDVAHSYHNPEEALVVVEVIHELLSCSTGERVQMNDIGVVCAFRRQVQKIRGLLRQEGFDAIRVGTVEDYQGQQERILIISTTLSDPSQAASLQELELVKGNAAESDQGPPDGELPQARNDVASALEACIRARTQRDESENGGSFPVEQRQTSNLIGNVRRFTVALSRAQCLLAVVGCAEVLETSPHWRRFLVHMAAHGSLRGERPSATLIAAATRVAAPEGASAEEEAEEACRDAAANGEDEGSPDGEQKPAGANGVSASNLDGDAWRQLHEEHAAEVASIAAELRRCAAQREEAIAYAKEIERKRQEDADDLRCVVCMDARKAVAFLPCGHLCVCKTCCPALFRADGPRCPTCRGRIEGSFFVFF